MFRDGIEMVGYKELSPSHVSAIIEMALSDHVSFADIRLQYGLNEREVVTLMRKSLNQALISRGANVWPPFPSGVNITNRLCG